METLSDDFCAWLDDASRDLERDLERRRESLENQQRMVLALQKVGEMVNEIESLREQLAEMVVKAGLRNEQFVGVVPVIERGRRAVEFVNI